MIKLRQKKAPLKLLKKSFQEQIYRYIKKRSMLIKRELKHVTTKTKDN